MMRAAIYARILVATLGGLLAVATSASAECAWVLWQTSSDAVPGPDPPRLLVIEPVRAYTTKARCQQKILDQLAKFKDSDGIPGLRPGKSGGLVPVDKSVIVLDELQEAYVTTKPWRDPKTGKVDEKSWTTTTTSYQFTCLPDTVDPRGPKGK